MTYNQRITLSNIYFPGLMMRSHSEWRITRLGLHPIVPPEPALCHPPPSLSCSRGAIPAWPRCGFANDPAPGATQCHLYSSISSRYIPSRNTRVATRLFKTQLSSRGNKEPKIRRGNCDPSRKDHGYLMLVVTDLFILNLCTQEEKLFFVLRLYSESDAGLESDEEGQLVSSQERKRLWYFELVPFHTC